MNSAEGTDDIDVAPTNLAHACGQGRRGPGH
jgi:hypothetical protein